MIKTYNEEELVKLYNEKIKKSNEYFNKYSNINLKSHSNNKSIKNWINMDLPRIFAILDLQEWIDKYELKNIKSLGYTSNIDPEILFFDSEEKTKMEYPEYDLHISYKEFENKFDFFMFNQTLEHLYNPLLSLKNIYRYIKQGGYVFTSVPNINIPHSTPIHYGGINPMGLGVLFISAGFEIVETGQWGNFNYLEKLFRTHSWPSLNNCPTYNEEKNVAQCWILAKKL